MIKCSCINGIKMKQLPYESDACKQLCDHPQSICLAKAEIVAGEEAKRAASPLVMGASTEAFVQVPHVRPGAGANVILVCWQESF